jgi:hypothetical protein
MKKGAGRSAINVSSKPQVGRASQIRNLYFFD